MAFTSAVDLTFARWLREFLPSNPAYLASIMATVETIDRGQAKTPANPESRG